MKARIAHRNAGSQYLTIAQSPLRQLEGRLRNVCWAETSHHHQFHHVQGHQPPDTSYLSSETLLLQWTHLIWHGPINSEKILGLKTQSECSVNWDIWRWIFDKSWMKSGQNTWHCFTLGYFFNTFINPSDPELLVTILITEMYLIQDSWSQD